VTEIPGDVQAHVRTSHAQAVQRLENVNGRGWVAEIGQPGLGEAGVGRFEELLGKSCGDGDLTGLGCLGYAQWDEGEGG